MSISRLNAGWLTCALIGVAGASPQAAPEATKMPRTSKPAALTEAQCYRVTRASVPALCREFGRNLNLQCDRPRMVCDQLVAPSMTDLFSLPEWEPLNALASFEWVEKVYRAQQSFNLPSRLSAWRSPPGEDPALRQKELEHNERLWRERETEVRSKVASGQLRASRARIDIDHNGSRELVYRVDDSSCDPKDIAWSWAPASPVMAVFNETTQEVDFRFAYFFAFGSARPILYKNGYVYITEWRDGENLALHDTIKQAFPICQYEHTPPRIKK
jgi:hypothetical protein